MSLPPINPSMFLATLLAMGGPLPYSKQKKPILQILEGKIIRRFDCIGDAVRYFGKDNKTSGSIVNALSGRRKSCYGYIWKYDLIK